MEGYQREIADIVQSRVLPNDQPKTECDPFGPRPAEEVEREKHDEQAWNGGLEVWVANGRNHGSAKYEYKPGAEGNACESYASTVTISKGHYGQKGSKERQGVCDADDRGKVMVVRPEQVARRRREADD